MFPTLRPEKPPIDSRPQTTTIPNRILLGETAQWTMAEAKVSEASMEELQGQETRNGSHISNILYGDIYEKHL